MREKICQGLEFAGIYLDPNENWQCHGERVISSKFSPIKVTVIPTNEEVIIARDTDWIAISSIATEPKACSIMPVAVAAR